MKNKKIEQGSLLPDEKAGLYGIESLTDAELLALIIRSGSKGISVHELSRRIIQELGGSIGGIVSSDAESLDSLHGVGRAKKMQLASIGELSRRIWNSHRDVRVPLKSSKEVYAFFREDLRGTSCPARRKMLSASPRATQQGNAAFLAGITAGGV